ncbi:Cof-type HAD-IIB family hydrolase [Staphylococcus sp. 17KM0847]|uniref:Cof-type HAD-IIB family hydrolase n=1 Tax=Staphylococcus sp. 17KM0847 TaxID=2583989 RepID=UPI0015DCC4C0|nr:Cof-type HAD-IIB family hydrolase [Staphylococcus sp. 17KM0847]QLK86243.1 HAD family phosphatase [Staphylococcus sp. 17KM0847]
MKPDLILFDMDDTLLTSQNKVSDMTRDYLLKVQEAGYKLALASGRPTFGMLKIAKQLQLDKYGSFIMSYNGGQTINLATEQVVARQSISKAAFERIVDFCRQHDMLILTYYENQIVCEGTNEYMGVESELTGMPMIQVEDIKRHVKSDVPKVMGVDHPEKVSHIFEIQKGQFDNDIDMTISKPFFLEFISKGVSKGKAIQKLAEQLDLSTDNMIAFGDSTNDIDMLETVGIGVAMGNARESVKEIADIVTKSNDEEGIPYALEQLIEK